MIREFFSDTRAQAVGYGNFFLALLVGAVMVWIVTAITDPIMSTARDHGSDPVATQSTTWISDFLAMWPVMIVIIAFFSLIVLAVFLRQIR